MHQLPPQFPHPFDYSATGKGAIVHAKAPVATSKEDEKVAASMKRLPLANTHSVMCLHHERPATSLR
jgi:hypothetical protein